MAEPAPCCDDLIGSAYYMPVSGMWWCTQCLFSILPWKIALELSEHPDVLEAILS